MVSAKRPRRPGPDLGPTVFVLFGATGDLAKRLVLPAFYRLAVEGLLPRQWLLVGNGRGDVADEEFRAHVHDALTEFGPHPQRGAWDSFAQRAFFAGGGFAQQLGMLVSLTSVAVTTLIAATRSTRVSALPSAARRPCWSSTDSD